MKKTAFILGAISIFTVCFGSLFKILHLPYATFIVAAGMLLILLFIPIMFRYLYTVSK